MQTFETYFSKQKMTLLTLASRCPNAFLCQTWTG